MIILRYFYCDDNKRRLLLFARFNALSNKMRECILLLITCR